MLECAAYFLLSAECIESHPDPAASSLATDYRKAADNISGLSTEVGRSVGMTNEAATARMMLLTKHLLAEINHNCVNVSVILLRYSEFCKQLNRDPMFRLKELLAGKDCTGSYQCK
jgi:hypothetical protein